MDTDRYQEAWISAGIFSFLCCIVCLPKIYRCCCKNKDYGVQVDESKQDGIEFRTERTNYDSAGIGQRK